ncbi:hypothetical protein Q9233_001836 [Columba guinea]|nr:hypothetical protein Q9233_001836 [Columba guinea]
MDTVEAMPARKSRLHVELECTCRREDMLCFPHCCKEELRQNQSASLLDTLCTGHHLDMEETTRCFQILVKAGPGQQLLHWQFWALAGGLVLLFGLCCWLRKRSHQPDSSSKRGSCGSLEEEVEEEEDPLYTDRFLWEYILWPLPNREETCHVVEDLVNDLLCVCRVFSGNEFMPRLQPAFGLGGFLESQSGHGEDLVYRLVVPLKPPPGHSFHLELGTEGEKPLRNSRLRVELECMCIRERKLGDMLCFIHHPEDELMGHQEASLLQTLCTGPYLDIEKTAFWLQELMTAACVAVLQSATCKLTVLPSPRYCKLKMTTAVETSLSIELVLAVQEDNSDTFVTME